MLSNYSRVKNWEFFSFFFGATLAPLVLAKKKKGSTATSAYLGYICVTCNFVFHRDLCLQFDIWVSSRICLGNSVVSKIIFFMQNGLFWDPPSNC